jgi:transposase
MKLDGKIEEIISMLIEGKTYRQIADNLGVALSTLHDFTSRPEHSARAREALEYSSDTYADKAEQVLIEAERDMIEISRARELAQYYKWKASKRSPKKYGDKIDVTTGGEKISLKIGYGERYED